MEPVTHLLTGACLGRAGFNRKTAYATLAATLAAEAPDLDMLWSLAGPVETLKHHRGITHTLVALPFVAAAIVAALWLVNRWRRPPHTHPPVHWGWLYLTACTAVGTHLLLDWTNNYGVRPFFPFQSRWYAGSIFFIAEPIVWALLFLAFFIPWVLGLADREIGARRQPFRGRLWAIFALTGILLLGLWRWSEHARALALLAQQPVTSQPALRLAAEPYPVNPFRWHAIVETQNFYLTAEINTQTDAITSDPASDILYKPTTTPAVQAAKRSFLGRVYLDWGSWAIVRDLGPVPAPGLPPPVLPPSRSWTTVQFSDLRFLYSFLSTQSNHQAAPLTGWVYIVDGNEVAGEGMDGREQR